jgi:hypothetical protein
MEEDVVERRVVQRDLVDVMPIAPRRSTTRDARPASSSTARENVRRSSPTTGGAAVMPTSASKAVTVDASGAASRTSRRWRPTWALSSAEVPSAMTRPWSMTAMRSAR